MTVSEKIYNLLSGNAALVALLAEGANSIKVPGNHQNVSRPYIVHFPVAPAPERTYKGTLPRCRWLYQVSVFADSPLTGFQIADAVRLAIDGIHPEDGGTRNYWVRQNYFYEPSTGRSFEAVPPVHHVEVEFDVYTSL